MNKTAIEWCDYTWNPVTGCWGPGGTAEKPNRCPYCYAEKVAKRFYPGLPDDPFTPVFWNSSIMGGNRLLQPYKVKKPAKIFVCSMADLFGDWIPEYWIGSILAIVRACPHHTFQFLTKNPKRLKDFNPWPENCWVGTTVTNQADADERLPWLLQVEARVRFVSHEPLLSPIFLRPSYWYQWGCKGRSPDPKTGKLTHFHDERCRRPWDWAIIGAMTGPGAMKPKPEWVQGLIDQYRAAGVPVFCKNNLHMAQGIQEWPDAR